MVYKFVSTVLKLPYLYGCRQSAKVARRFKYNWGAEFFGHFDDTTWAAVDHIYIFSQLLSYVWDAMTLNCTDSGWDSFPQ